MIRRGQARLRSFPCWRCGLAIALLALATKPIHGDWPFDPPKRPAVPRVRFTDWPRNPIDAFVLARLEEAGLRPNPPADKITLLRRITFDLTGLLPTPAERQAFVNDASADAYQRVVERLLASPRFGERWAQHWLDVVRYAETEGFKVDRLRPNAYRYRDYVIRACNSDLPYDRFIRQQVAGDESEPDNPDALIATGFYRLHPEESNGSNYRLIRQDILDDITDVFGVAFLGLTVGCARCHDHKFDPLSQKEYYGLQAFFAPLVQRDDLPLAPPREQESYRRQMAKWEAATRTLRQRRDALLASARQAIFAEVLATFDGQTKQAMTTPAAKRTALQCQLAVLAGKQIDRRFARAFRRLSKEQRAVYDDLQKQIAAFDALKPRALPMAMGVVNAATEAPATYRLATGNYRKPRERVKPDYPECCGNRRGAARRGDLADWLCRSDHPLTGRVMVNRLWQHYMGAGIVATPNDFGAMGEKPTHPKLLDYLATELVRKGWKLKAIHRLIVTSATYRQLSSPRNNPTAAKARQVDPANKLLWHARVKRREGEAIRDAVLQASGQLNLRMCGPSACPELPAALADYGWDADDKPSERNRRSIYVFAKRNFAYPLFAAFDQPDRVNSCPVRAATITAPQALAMLNGEFTLAQARHLSESLRAETGCDRRKFIRAAYLRLFDREPDSGETAAAEVFLQKQAKHIATEAQDWAAERNALVDFCHALVNSAEFLDVP